MPPIRPLGHLAALVLASSLSCVAQAQPFVNLDFEQAQVDGSTIFQPWATALPGWQHSDGADTQSVYWGTTHLSTTQMYRLYGAGQPDTPSGFPFEGQYGVYFKSGMSSVFDDDAQWVHAFLAQTGTLAANTQSIHLLADGPLSVTLGGYDIDLIDLGNHHFAGDVSAFAGQTLELRIIDTTTSFAPGLYLDKISWSASAVPEPGTAPLALVGIGLLGLWWRRPAKH